MGKARILEAHGEGRYTIEIIEARERAEVAKQEAEARIQTLRANITSLKQRIASAQATVNQAAAEQDAAINHYQQDMAEEGQSSINLEAFSSDLLEAARHRDALQAEHRTHELRIAADEALVARINALPPLRQMQAWCADYTEDLSGEVATAEVPGEIGSVIIKPGFEGNAWSAAEDGAMQPTLASTPAATFYNLAMLPGWQKWRPTFRTATLTRLDGDSCSITLDATTSSQQGLGVNAQSSYSNVPILYMDCNGSAFEEGDQVLVAFAGNVEGPTVVGFEQKPRECNTHILVSFPLTEYFIRSSQAFAFTNNEQCFVYPYQENGDDVSRIGLKGVRLSVGDNFSTVEISQEFRTYSLKNVDDLSNVESIEQLQSHLTSVQTLQDDFYQAGEIDFEEDVLVDLGEIEFSGPPFFNGRLIGSRAPQSPVNGLQSFNGDYLVELQHEISPVSGDKGKAYEKLTLNAALFMSEDYGFYTSKLYGNDDESVSCYLDLLLSRNAPTMTPRKPITFGLGFIDSLNKVVVGGHEFSPVGFVGLLPSETNIYQNFANEERGEAGIGFTIVAGRYNVVLAYSRSDL
jgi:hypothetical protein